MCGFGSRDFLMWSLVADVFSHLLTHCQKIQEYSFIQSVLYFDFSSLACLMSLLTSIFRVCSGDSLMWSLVAEFFFTSPYPLSETEKTLPQIKHLASNSSPPIVLTNIHRNILSSTQSCILTSSLQGVE